MIHRVAGKMIEAKVVGRKIVDLWLRVVNRVHCCFSLDSGSRMLEDSQLEVLLESLMTVPRKLKVTLMMRGILEDFVGTSFVLFQETQVVVAVEIG